MKEMLLAIDLVDKKREHIRQRLTKFEYMLKQINIATSLYRQYITELQQGQKVSSEYLFFFFSNFFSDSSDERSQHMVSMRN